METPHGHAFHEFLRTSPLAGPPEASLWELSPGSATAAATKTARRASGSTVRCLNVCLRVRPERREEFLAAIFADQAGTLRDEPLALAFLVGEDASTPNTFHLHEQ